MSVGTVLTRFSLGLSALNAAMALLNTRRFRGLPIAPAPTPGPILVCVPARDEGPRIGNLIADLRAQRDVPDLRVVVYDDCSGDDTAERARAAIADDDRITLVSGTTTPPPGWTGKAWALHRLTEALPPTETHLCFVDADVRLGPDALARAVHEFAALDDAGGRRSPGLLSVWPQQLSGSTAETLVQPLLSWSWFALLPLAITERHLRPSTAIANGQFLLTTRSRHARIGGHRAVAGSLTDDLDLARAYRQAGFTTHVRGGHEDVRCRMYGGADELRSGYRRWLATEVGGTGGALVVATLALVGYVWPVAALATASRRSGAAALVLAAGSRMAARGHEAGRITPTDVASAVGHPAAMTITAALLIDSARLTRSGALRWKGRPVGRSGDEDVHPEAL
ncbi:glycosyltransferase family 2 protein [Williamsia phyllosphaerae]|uniref:Glycosyl transferase n=1 Tax=Williamsia phyllosphaerae TaxID=885042 RepID=A0ABQ1UZV6_9NOCA|nr:glycosyltransferase family 2 protein [Williamsia phyllosphaerae]GGF29412.1 glycosyl transferase [Williamsia phyllosphaerae]